MGNCLVLEEKRVRVRKADGKIIEYKSPAKVHQVLSEFSNHAIYDGVPVAKHLLHPDAEMVHGKLYHLLPLPVSRQQAKKKKVSFTDDPPDPVEAGKENGVVRIKVVITKQELKAMLEGDDVSVENLIPQVHKNKTASN